MGLKEENEKQKMIIDENEDEDDNNLFLDTKRQHPNQKIIPSNGAVSSSCGNNNSPLKFVIIFLLGLTCVHFAYICAIHLKSRIADEMVKTYRWYHFPSPCKTPLVERQDMINLTYSSILALTDLSLSAPVCYGTLWGVLRQEQPEETSNLTLPWDNNVDFCILYSELKNLTHEDLYTAFGKRGVKLSHFDWNSGSYTISKGKAGGEINVFFDCSWLFYATHSEVSNHLKPEVETLPGPLPEVDGWACPMGIKPTLARWLKDLNRPFPIWLLQPPFPTKTVDGLTASVTHDNMEIQKYLYPDEWWLEAKPPGC